MKEIGTIFASDGPNAKVVPYTSAIVYKLQSGQLYISDSWFGNVFLPSSIINGQIIETRPGCYGIITFKNT